MTRLRYLTPFFILFLILLSSSVVSSQAQDIDFVHPLGQNQSMIEDAKVYASLFNVDLDEAIRRLTLQATIGELASALPVKEIDTFCGLWLQHTPQFRLVIGFTQDGEKTIRPYLESKSFADIVEIHTMNATLQELERAQEISHIILDTLNIPTDSLIRESENLVELRVTDIAKLDFALVKSGMQLPPQVVIIQVDKLMTPVTDIFGGKSLSQCTSGFSVVNSNGVKGITTAAHCPDSISYNGINLPYQSGLWGWQYDIQWHRADQSFTVRNLIFDGSNNRFIFTTKRRTQQFEGELVCKYGKATNQMVCNTIISKFCRPTGGDAPPNATATYILVNNANTSQGDSGGPVFFNNTAYGTTVATSNGTDFIYMAIDYFDALGIAILVN